MSAAGATLLLAVYSAFVALVPHGPGEFAYITPSPWLPFHAMFGFTLEQAAEHLSRWLLLGPGLLLLSHVLARRLGPVKLPQLDRPGWTLTCAAALAAAATLGFMLLLFRRLPITDDEYTYLAQAQLLASGRLARPMLPGEVGVPFLVAGEAGVTGKYLFGEPLVQVLGAWLKAPALMHVAFAAGSVLCVHAATRLLWGDRSVAAGAAAALAISPMFLFTGATGGSQSTSLFCVALVALGHALIISGRPHVGVLAFGVGVAFGMVVRPQAIAPIGLAIGVMVVVHLVRQRAWLAVLVLGLLGFGALFSVFEYNERITGSALELPWALSEPRETYGFGGGLGPRRHTVGLALWDTFTVLVRLNAAWLGLPFGLVVVALAIRLRAITPGFRVWWWATAALFAFQFGYYSPGVSDTGAMYHFETLVPLSMLAGATLVAAHRARPHLTAVAVTLHVLLGTGSYFFVHTARLSRLVERIHSVPQEVIAAAGSNSLVVVESRCDEVLKWGWVQFPFPRIVDPDRDAVLFVRRPSPGQLALTLEATSTRRCLYYRPLDDRGQGSLVPCATAKAALERHNTARQCVFVPSTALLRLGPVLGVSLVSAASAASPDQSLDPR